jgi:tetratricopeptide (TPR) repeat protein
VGAGEGVARPLVVGIKGLVWRRVALAAAIVVLIGGVAWWLRPYALAAYHVEVGGRALEEALEPVFMDWLAPEQVMDAGRLDAAEAHLQAALRWQRESVQARRLLARVYLSTGRPEAALAVLQEVVELRPENPVFHLELGDAYDALGNTEGAIAAYEEGRIGSRSVPLAANTLKVAEEKAQQGSGDVAIELWQKTLETDPGNLYALYRLAGAHRELGDEKGAERYQERLRYFELESVAVPLDFRLAAFQGRAMAGLVEDGIWGREKLLNVLSYQVWQFAEDVRGLMTERLLETVLERRPEDADVLFYRAELYQRRGELDKADEAYRKVMAADPEYAQTYLRLGMVAEERGRGASAALPSTMLGTGGMNSGQGSEGAGEQGGGGAGDLGEAAAWYSRYHEMAPEDLLGLKRLAEVCGALEEAGVEDGSCRATAERVGMADKETKGQEEGGRGETGEEETPAAVLGEALAEHTDDRRIVAELLGVPVEDVELGPNLVENGRFESWTGGSPKQWTWVTQFNQEMRGAAVFVGGDETLCFWDGHTAARVDGLWVQDQEGKESARAGFRWHDAIDLMAESAYFISFKYRTVRSSDGGTAVWLTGSDDVLWSHNHRVAASDGSWYGFVAVGWNHSGGERQIYPLLRSYVTGTAAFDNVQVRPIELAEGTTVGTRKTVLWMRESESGEERR